MKQYPLTETGTLLYGERWQTALGLALRVSNMTIYRWLTDDDMIPKEYAASVRALLDRRHEELSSAGERDDQALIVTLWPSNGPSHAARALGVARSTIYMSENLDRDKLETFRQDLVQRVETLLA